MQLFNADCHWVEYEDEFFRVTRGRTRDVIVSKYVIACGALFHSLTAEMFPYVVRDHPRPRTAVTTANPLRVRYTVDDRWILCTTIYYIGLP